MKTAKTENIKNTKNKRAPTFIKEGRENNRVSIILCKPFMLFTNFSNLETLKTLITLASYGPTLKNDNPDPSEDIIKSIIELNTTNKSN